MDVLSATPRLQLGNASKQVNAGLPAKRKKKKIVLFQRQTPLLRITADATLKRPPRLTYGYCMVSGSNRNYAHNSADVCAERLLFVENWCGSPEQALASLTQGHGFQGHMVADIVAKALPAILTNAALKVAFRARPKGKAVDPLRDNNPAFLPDPRDKVLLAAKQLALAAGLTAEGKAPDAEWLKGHHDVRKLVPGTTEFNAVRAGRSVVQQRVVEVVHAAFHAVQQELLQSTTQQSTVDLETSGTSLLVCIVRGKTLVVAGVGLCRAVLGRDVDGQELKDAIEAARQPGRPGAGGHAGLAVLREVSEDIEARHRSDSAKHEAAAMEAAESGLASKNSLSLLPKLRHITTKDGRQILRTGLHFTTREAMHGIGTAVVGDPSAPVGSAGGLLSGTYNRTSAMTRLTRLLAESAIVDTSSKDLSKATMDPEEEKRRKVLHSESMPTFPDLPVVIERTLQFKGQTYLKPSSLLQQKRAELVKLLTAGVDMQETSRKELEEWELSLQEQDQHRLDLAIPSGSGHAPLNGSHAHFQRTGSAQQQATTGNDASKLDMLGSASRRSAAIGREVRSRMASSRAAHAMSSATASPLASVHGTGMGMGRHSMASTAYSLTEELLGTDEIGGPFMQDVDAGMDDEDGVHEAERRAIDHAIRIGRDPSKAAREAGLVRQAVGTMHRARLSSARGVLTTALDTHSMAEEELRQRLYPELVPGAGPIDYSVPPTEFEGSSLGRGVLQKYNPIKADLELVRTRTAGLGSSGVGGGTGGTYSGTVSTGRQSTGRGDTTRTKSAGGTLSSSRLQLLPGAAASGAGSGSFRQYGPVGGHGVDPANLRPDMGDRVLGAGVRDLLGFRGINMGTGLPPEHGLQNFRGSQGGNSYGGMRGSGSFTGSVPVSGQPGGGPRAGQEEDMQRITQELNQARMFDEQGRAVRVIVPVMLVSEQRPDRPDELLRIQGAGGRVNSGHLQGGVKGGVPRIFGPHKDAPGLSTSRCLGYTSANQYGVIAEPEIVLRSIEPSDRFVILGSEGLWAVLSSTEAVDIVAKTLDAILWGGTAEGEYRRMAEEARRKMRAQVAAEARVHSAAPSRGGRSDAGGDEEDEDSEEDEQPIAAAGTATASLKDIARTGNSLPGGMNHPAVAAVAANPSLGARPALPGIAHPAPGLHVTPSPTTEMCIVAAPGQAPVAGAGSGADTGVTDLLDSFLPPLVRARRADRLRRVAVAAAEALVSAAKTKWALHVAKYTSAVDEGKIGMTGVSSLSRASASAAGGAGAQSQGAPAGLRATAGGVSGPDREIRPEHIIHQDISVLVMLLDHA